MTFEEKRVFQNQGNLVNNICFGKDYFSKLWPIGNPIIGDHQKSYSFYQIADLSFGYFISNLIEDVMNQLGIPIEEEFKKYLYPIQNSKEAHRIEICEVKLNKINNRL